MTIPRYPMPDPRTRLKPVRVTFPGSILDNLRQAADELIAQFPWDEEEVIWFVLTGTATPALPIQFSSTCTKRERYSFVLLTLTMEPWLPAEVVRDAYVMMQRRFLGQQHGSGPMNKELFEFVVDHMGSGGSIPDWSTLVKEWNEQRGHKRRYARWRFIRDYERARDHIVFFGSGIWHERLQEEMAE